MEMSEFTKIKTATVSSLIFSINILHELDNKFCLPNLVKKTQPNKRFIGV